MAINNVIRNLGYSSPQHFHCSSEKCTIIHQKISKQKEPLQEKPLMMYIYSIQNIHNCITVLVVEGAIFADCRTIF